MKQLLKRFKINNLKKLIKKLFLSIAVLFSYHFLVYFLKPFYFDYNGQKDIIQKRLPINLN